MDLTEEQKHFLGFHLACQLDDYEQQIRREKKLGKDMKAATEQLHRLEYLIYTKFIPDSWCGPKPTYWKDE